MAFSLTATVGSTSITLSDRNPYCLLSATGMGAADVRRVTTRGPAQDGDTDKGYRLAPREIELVLGFQGTTDAILDGYRDTLTSFFKPLPSTPVKLKVTRDDGELRQIDCYVVGSIKIDLLKEHRPGHYHRATVRLRAPDPAWYEVAPGTASFTGTADFLANWWLAGGAIGASQVLMHGGTPALDEAWTSASSLTGSVSWTLAVRAGSVSALGSAAYMFSKSPNTGDNSATFGVAGTLGFGTSPPYYVIGNATKYPSLMSGGTSVYFYHSDPAGFPYSAGLNFTFYRTTWVLDPGGGFDSYGAFGGFDAVSTVPGTTMKWRTLGWSGAVQLYALYYPGLSYSQRAALQPFMAGTAGTVANTLTIPYEGNLPEYPTLSLSGPIANAVITNTATGEVLDFTGSTINAGTTYVIDTRYGYKTVLYGTVSKRDQLSDDSDLGTWHIAPDPVATGGTNIITVNGSGNGTATALSIVYYNRFSSF